MSSYVVSNASKTEDILDVFLASVIRVYVDNW